MRETAARTIQRMLVHDLDPIMLCPVRTPFRIWRNGTFVTYDAQSLLRYVKSSGDVRDPVTRQDLATHEMRRLCRLACESYTTIEDLKLRHDEEIQRREIVAFFEDEFRAQLETPTFHILDVINDLRLVVTERELSRILHPLLNHRHVLVLPPII